MPWMLGMLLLGLLCLPPAAWAQSSDRSAVEERLQRLREQIERDEQRLSATSEAEEASMRTLRNLDREMAMRRELTTTYQRRLQQLSEESDSLQKSWDVQLGDVAEALRARGSE